MALLNGRATMPCKRLVIAFDGPAGAGKSTVARLTAKELGYLYLDTGAMYRALALKALTQGVDLRDQEQLSALLGKTAIELEQGRDHVLRVYLDGREVSDLLRTPEVNASVSLVAEFPDIRSEMVMRQRAVAKRGGVVMDGRDIGTVVLPDADVKFFLTASLRARAQRRQIDLKALGYEVDLAQLAADIEHRDALDSSRAHSPLRQANDAVLVDTTEAGVEAVLERILRECRKHVC